MTEKEKQERIFRIKEQVDSLQEELKELTKVDDAKTKADKDKALAKAKKKYEKQFVLVEHEPAIYIKEITEIDNDDTLAINGINFNFDTCGYYDDEIDLNYEEYWSEDSLSIISRDKLIKMIEDTKKERVGKLDKMIQKINSIQ